jgi:hypothetical protein
MFSKYADIIPQVCRIRTKEGGIKPFHLYDWQKQALSDLGNKNIILKARQIGFSTISVALFYLKTITQQGANTKIIANKSEIATVLLDTIKIIHNSIPENLRPPCDYNNRYEFFFKKTQSRLSISASTKDVGRGETIHNLLCSEVAFWDNADEAMLGLLECVPSSGFIIVESTPNGVGNWYHRRYTEAKDLGWKALKYDWQCHPEYNQDWADQKKKEKGIQGFAQEYDCDFINSGQGVYTDILGNISAQLPTEVKQTVNAIEYFFEGRLEGQEYVIGCDTSGGYSDGDKSAVFVLNKKTLKTAYLWHGKIAPDRLGTEIILPAAKKYEAFTGIEVNNHGLTTINAIKEENIDLYRRERRDRVTNEVTKELGWNTNAKSKPELIDLGRTILSDESITELPEPLINELRTFVKKQNGEIGAEAGCNDDLVMAWLIGQMMIASNPFFEFKKKEREYMV